MLESDKKDFLNVLGYFYLRNNKFSKAAVIFRALHCLMPEDHRTLGSLAYAFLMTGQESEAKEYSKRFMENCPKQSKKNAFYLMAKIMWKNDDHENAARYLKQFLSVKDN